jgi:hypothetical protein
MDFRDKTLVRDIGSSQHLSGGVANSRDEAGDGGFSMMIEARRGAIRCGAGRARILLPMMG